MTLAPDTAPFRRRPPSLARQVAWGTWVSLAAPVVRGLEATGLARSSFSSIMSRRDAALRSNNPLAGYAAGPQDVFVATYPKSGTNWMLQIALQLVHHGEAEYEHIHDVVPWPDAAMMPGGGPDAAIPLEQAHGWRTAPERKRVIKTHLYGRELPIESEARFLVVVRDPKDVFVSGYHFARDSFLGPAMPSVKTWYRLFLQGKSIGGNWVRSTASYWAARRRGQVKVFSFKAMKRDLRGTVREVAEFLGIRAPEAVLDKVCAKSSFEAMKAIDEKFRVGRRIPWGAEGPMLRRGEHGASAELLTREQQREIDRFFLAELLRHRCDIPYEEFADLA